MSTDSGGEGEPSCNHQRMNCVELIQYMSDDGPCKVRYQRISADIEQVSVDMRESQQTSNQAALFDHF